MSSELLQLGVREHVLVASCRISWKYSSRRSWCSEISVNVNSKRHWWQELNQGACTHTHKNIPFSICWNSASLELTSGRFTILLSSLLMLDGLSSWTLRHCCSMSKLHSHWPGWFPRAHSDCSTHLQGKHKASDQALNVKARHSITTKLNHENHYTVYTTKTRTHAEIETVFLTTWPKKKIQDLMIGSYKKKKCRLGKTNGFKTRIKCDRGLLWSQESRGGKWKTAVMGGQVVRQRGEKRHRWDREVDFFHQTQTHFH